MTTADPPAQPIYAERLAIPRRWWVIATVGVALGGAEVFAGFDWHIIAIVYAGLAIPTALLLVGMGRTRLRVDGDGLHAGGRVLASDDIAEAVLLDARGTRHMLGPGRNPDAHVVARGFVKTAVLLRPADDATPYWLVTTRRPRELLAALGFADQGFVDSEIS